MGKWSVPRYKREYVYVAGNDSVVFAQKFGLLPQMIVFVRRTAVIVSRSSVVLLDGSS